MRFAELLPSPALSLQQLCTQEWDMETSLLCKTHMPDNAENTAIQLCLKVLWRCSLQQLRTVILERFWDGNFSLLLLCSTWPYVPWVYPPVHASSCDSILEALYFEIDWDICSCNPKNQPWLNNTPGFNLRVEAQESCSLTAIPDMALDFLCDFAQLM